MRIRGASRGWGKLKANQKQLLEDDDGGLSLDIILAVIAVLIGVSLIGTVAFQASEAQANASVTGAADALTGLIPVIFVAGLLIGAVGLMLRDRS